MRIGDAGIDAIRAHAQVAIGLLERKAYAALDGKVAWDDYRRARDEVYYPTTTVQTEVAIAVVAETARGASRGPGGVR